ncbi:stage II sporulation protein M [Rothia sp. LK2588]|uniref:stage II sporulation protein M n=1 Tax=Rothia sp. LK2588 TaxID=3114369 RepID=UPI0034CE6564
MAAVLACVLFIVSTVAGYLLLDNNSLASAIEPQKSPSYFSSVGHILQTNVPTALSLFAGVITLGVAALFLLPLVGMFLGASMNVAVSIYGPGEVVARTVLYTPFEIAGFVVAATAGVLPLVVFTRRFIAGAHSETSRNAPRNSFRQTLHSVLNTSLKLLGLSLVILVVAAFVEGFAVLQV